MVGLTEDRRRQRPTLVGNRASSRHRVPPPPGARLGHGPGRLLGSRARTVWIAVTLVLFAVHPARAMTVIELRVKQQVPPAHPRGVRRVGG